MNVLLVLLGIIVFAVLRGYFLRYMTVQKVCKPDRETGAMVGNCPSLGYDKDYQCLPDASIAYGAKDRMKCMYEGFPFPLLRKWGLF